MLLLRVRRHLPTALITDALEIHLRRAQSQNGSTNTTRTTSSTTTRLRGDRVYHDVTYGPACTCSAPIQAGDGAHRIYAAREPQPSFSLLAAIRQPQQVSRSYLPSGVMRRWNCRSNAVTTSDKSFLVDWVPRSGISPYPGANHWKITRRLFVRLAEH
jgi:hypothetical protein